MSCTPRTRAPRRLRRCRDRYVVGDNVLRPGCKPKIRAPEPDGHEHPLMAGTTRSRRWWKAAAEQSGNHSEGPLSGFASTSPSPAISGPSRRARKLGLGMPAKVSFPATNLRAALARPGHSRQCDRQLPGIPSHHCLVLGRLGSTETAWRIRDRYQPRRTSGLPSAAVQQAHPRQRHRQAGRRPATVLSYSAPVPFWLGWKCQRHAGSSSATRRFAPHVDQEVS
jgi:hypothetical protein